MLLIINGRFHLWDFHVYYHAAEDWLSGGEVYGKSYGLSSGFYKYSLTALIPFVPFTFLPYFWAASVYYFSLLFLIIQFTKRWSKWLKKEESKWTISAVVFCTLFFFGDHLERIVSGKHQFSAVNSAHVVLASNTIFKMEVGRLDSGCGMFNQASFCYRFAPYRFTQAMDFAQTFWHRTAFSFSDTHYFLRPNRFLSTQHGLVGHDG